MRKKIKKTIETTEYEIYCDICNSLIEYKPYHSYQCYVCGRDVCNDCKVYDYIVSYDDTVTYCKICKKLENKYRNPIIQKENELEKFEENQYRLWKEESLNTKWLDKKDK